MSIPAVCFTKFELELQRCNRQLPIEPLNMEIVMNWDVIQGNWAQYKGHVKAQWGKLTDDNLDVIAGKREELAGQIQKSYGIAMDDADKQIKAFQKYLKDSTSS